MTQSPLRHLSDRNLLSQTEKADPHRARDDIEYPGAPRRGRQPTTLLAAGLWDTV